MKIVCASWKNRMDNMLVNAGWQISLAIAAFIASTMLELNKHSKLCGDCVGTRVCFGRFR